MAAKIVNQGLQRIGVNASQATGTGVTFNSARFIRSGSVDDSSVAFAAGDTALNSGGAVSNQADIDLTSATRSGEVVTHVFTFGTGVANFTIRRISLHDDTAANVTTSSTTLTAGIDGQTLTKTSDFTMTFTLTITYTDNS